MTCTGQVPSAFGYGLPQVVDPPFGIPARLPVDPNSARIIAGIGPDLPLRPDFGRDRYGVLYSILYLVVDFSVVAGNDSRPDPILPY